MDEVDDKKILDREHGLWRKVWTLYVVRVGNESDGGERIEIQHPLL